MNTITKKVEDALEQIRPYLQADGGNVSLVENYRQHDRKAGIAWSL